MVWWRKKYTLSDGSHEGLKDRQVKSQLFMVNNQFKFEYNINIAQKLAYLWKYNKLIWFLNLLDIVEYSW